MLIDMKIHRKAKTRTLVMTGLIFSAAAPQAFFGVDGWLEVFPSVIFLGQDQV